MGRRKRRRHIIENENYEEIYKGNLILEGYWTFFI